ncbi:MAG: adenylate/guanylate cyclase domain-containing protein [Pseudomonadota bacterium]
MQVIGAAVMADVSGSTRLFEQVGQQRALRGIKECLDDMRVQIHTLGGVFLHSKGDDVLAFFEQAEAALEMAKHATARSQEDALKVHAGLSWGSMLMQTNDLHGTPVNIASRLASLAKPHEVLVYETAYERLSAQARRTLHAVDALSLKGTGARLSVYSHVAEDPSGETLDFTETPGTSDMPLTVTLSHADVVRLVQEGDEIALGRALDADIIVSQPWVSRLHATVSVINGIAVIKDCSTLGSYVRMDEGREVLARRGNVTLIGNGKISLGAPFSRSTQAVIEYTQTRAPVGDVQDG